MTSTHKGITIEKKRLQYHVKCLCIFSKSSMTTSGWYSFLQLFAAGCEGQIRNAKVRLG